MRSEEQLRAQSNSKQLLVMALLLKKNNYSVKSGSSLECLTTSCVKNKQAKKLKQKITTNKQKTNIKTLNSFFCTHPPNFTSSVPTCLTNAVHCRCTVLYM